MCFILSNFLLVKVYGTILLTFRDIAKKCEFTNEDEAVHDHLIKTMMNNKLRIKTIRNNWSLAQILDEAAIEEETTSQANEMQKKL